MAKTAGEGAREARLATGISQRMAAQAAGINQVALCRIEQSKGNYLPRDIVDRLADVYARFGISRDYLRRFAPPDVYPEAANTTLPDLRPALLSTLERKAIRQKMKQWAEGGGARHAFDFIARIEPLKRAIVERFIQRYPETASYETCYSLAGSAVLDLARNPSSEADIESQLRNAIEARLTQHLRRTEYRGPLTPLQQWQGRLINLIDSDFVKRGDADTIPVFRCSPVRDDCVAISFNLIVERHGRPPKLAQRRTVYGIRVPDTLLGPYCAANDLVLLEAMSPLQAEEEIGLVFAIDDKQIDYVPAAFAHARQGNFAIDVRYTRTGHTATLKVGDVVFHHALKVEDLLP